MAKHGFAMTGEVKNGVLHCTSLRWGEVVTRRQAGARVRGIILSV
jgi:hypothetical protein